MIIVLQSNNVSLLISTTMARMIAMETTFTASKKALMIFDVRSFGIHGLRRATNKKEGRKIPMVAAIAPGAPLICHPINVAEENTGPGVNCPTAIASTNCCLVSNPFVTSSASRKANRTYPLP